MSSLHSGIPQGPAEQIYYNGTILTMTGPEPPDADPEAMAVAAGRVLALGNRADLESLAGPDTEWIDLDGRTLLPGFYDAHSHFGDAARLAAFYCDLSGRPAGRMTCIDDYVTALREHMAGLDPEAPVLGSSYDPESIREKRHPRRYDLDRVSRDRPVIVYYYTGSMCAVNSCALHMLGITRETPDPVGGKIGHADDGEPDGLLIETAAYGILESGRLPRIDTRERLLAALAKSSLLYASRGVTTVNEGADADPELFLEASRAGFLKQRACLWLKPEDLISWHEQAFAAIADPTDPVSANSSPSEVSPLTLLDRYGSVPLSDYVSIGGGKIFADGAMNIGTASLTEPYYQPIAGHPADYCGLAVLSDAEIAEKVRQVTDRGYNMFIHANGDAAVASCIRAYRSVRERHPHGNQHLILLHAQLVQPQQFAAMRELDLTPSFFCANIYYSGDRLYERLLGPERAQQLDPIGTAFRWGLPATMHQDTPVEPMDPLFSIWSSVNRRTSSGRLLGPDERLTPYQALLANTLYAARQNGEGWCKGSLEPGKYADCVILDRNPLTCGPDAIKEISVLATIVGGTEIWQQQ